MRRTQSIEKVIILKEQIKEQEDNIAMLQKIKFKNHY
jgi:hypothetical protein